MILQYTVFYSFLILITYNFIQILFFSEFVFKKRNKLVKLLGINGKNIHDLPFTIGSSICFCVAIFYAKLPLFWFVYLLINIIGLIAELTLLDKRSENKVYISVIKQKYKDFLKFRIIRLIINLIVICLWIYSWIKLTPSLFRELFNI